MGKGLGTKQAHTATTHNWEKGTSLRYIVPMYKTLDKQTEWKEVVVWEGDETSRPYLRIDFAPFGSARARCPQLVCWRR